MATVDAIKAQIVEAFSGVEFPGDWCLQAGTEGDEPFLVTKEFSGKNDWRTLDAAFIDQAPAGFGSALSFFSDEAFHFYLPAYLIADLDGKLQYSDPVFHLTHSLTDLAELSPVNPRRYGERTWFQHAHNKFAMFNQKESKAIVGYLWLKMETDEFARKEIEEALLNYWMQRAGD